MHNPETSLGNSSDSSAEMTMKTGTPNARGYLVVISAPSGGGKTTVIRRLLEHREPDFMYSVSATTRAPRPGEQHGCDYFFLSMEKFMARVNEGRFIEWAKVHGNYYGTPKETVDSWLRAGKFIFMDLDVQGGINVKKQYGDRAILIFIEPPSLESLRERLVGRNTDSPQVIQTRLDNAAAEMEMARHYDHVSINYNLDDTVAEVRALIGRYRTS